MPKNFEFQDLQVWQKSVDFINKIYDLIEKIESPRHHYRVVEQIESASLSIAANIAEGKGRHFDKEYLKFLYYSRGSLYETVTILEIFKKRGWILENDYLMIYEDATEIGKMLNGLIRSIRNRQTKQ